jgi:peptidoglycan LD-endopeptidase LytH
VSRLGWWMLLGFVAIIAGFVLLTRLGSAPDTGTEPVIAAAGDLAVPVVGVASAQLTDTWGQSRAGGARAHEAIDIMAPRGTPVVAAAAGRVEKIFESENGGHTVYVRRIDPAWQDYYAHLDAYAPGLREGMTVAQGQLLGTVGSTGDAGEDAPHLHYAINAMAGGDRWHEGRAVNPFPVLAGSAVAR